MATAALILALAASAITVTQQGVGLVASIKALHHHSTRPLYRHVLKPVCKAVSK